MHQLILRRVQSLAFALVASTTLMHAQTVPSILISNVSTAVQMGDLATASTMVAQYRKQKGDTPEALEAFSWVARGELRAGDLDRAAKDAEETRRLSQAALHGRPLDADAHLAMAMGAAFEVEAQAMDVRHQKTEAVELLQSAIHTWHGTSIVARLQKNLNLLTLQGKLMPALHETEWIGAKPPAAATLSHKVVLLFFWAHWCPDCKAEAPILARLQSTLGSKGLVTIAPSKRYGYTGDDDAPDAAKEKQYIQKIFGKYYASIPDISAPLDAANFDRFGASTTPTLVVADRHGIVRLYHPGVLDEAALRAVIEPLL